MKIPIQIWMRRGDKRTLEDCVLWVGEIPPQYQRGRNRKMKSRKYKRDLQAQLLESQQTTLEQETHRVRY